MIGGIEKRHAEERTWNKAALITWAWFATV